jgi:dephospho-CoA kinase
MGLKKPIIGLCGGIGAGKSLVAAEFERLGCMIIDSDRLNHEVLRRPAVLATLREWWTDDVVDANGEPNRRRIAEIVFADGEQKQRLERLVYPLIAELREDMIRKVNEDQAAKAVILDSPLLFESNLDSLCDTIVFVETSRTKRLQRLKQSRHWSNEQLREREQWQEALTDKRSHSEFIINNDGPPEQLRPQVMNILGKIVTRNSAKK